MNLIVQSVQDDWQYDVRKNLITRAVQGAWQYDSLRSAQLGYERGKVRLGKLVIRQTGHKANWSLGKLALGKMTLDELLLDKLTTNQIQNSCLDILGLS